MIDVSIVLTVFILPENDREDRVWIIESISFARRSGSLLFLRVLR